MPPRNPDKRIAPSGLFAQLMDTVGDGTGTSEMVTGGAGNYKVSPGAGFRYHLYRMNVYIEEGVNEKFDAAQYGSTRAMSTGIIIKVKDGDGDIANLTPLEIKKIGQWDLVAGVDMKFTDFPSGAADYCGVRWSLSRHGGPIILDGDLGQFLNMSVGANPGAGGLALVSHVATVQGFKEAT